LLSKISPAPSIISGLLSKISIALFINSDL